MNDMASSVTSYPTPALDSVDETAAEAAAAVPRPVAAAKRVKRLRVPEAPAAAAVSAPLLHQLAPAPSSPPSLLEVPTALQPRRPPARPAPAAGLDGVIAVGAPPPPPLSSPLSPAALPADAQLPAAEAAAAFPAGVQTGTADASLAEGEDRATAAPAPAPSPARAPRLRLRAYQEDAVRAVLDHAARGHNRQLVQVPTGGGKTVMFVDIARRLNRRTLVIAHRSELVDQAVAKIKLWWPGVEVGVVDGRVKASLRPAEFECQVVVATIQTLSKDAALRAVSKQNFGLLIVDEAHHSTATTYRNLIAVVMGAPPPRAPDDFSEEAVVDNTAFVSGEDSVHGSAFSFLAASLRARQAAVKGSLAPVKQAAGRAAAPPSPPLSSAADSSGGTGDGDDDGSSSSSSSSVMGGGQDAGSSLRTATPAVPPPVAVSRPPAAAPKDAKPILLGFTATGWRNDSSELGQVFQIVSYQTTIRELIDMRQLCDIRAYKTATGVDLTGVQLTRDIGDGEGRDFNQTQLVKVVNSPTRNALIARAYLKHARGRLALTFCCNVSHAESVRAAMVYAGVDAEVVHSKMAPQERERVLDRLRDEQSGLQVLVNCEILTEGFDHPAIDCIIMARPTYSTGLYTQCIGRGFRLSPGKTDCLVLDFTDRGHVLGRLPDLSTVVPEHLEEDDTPLKQRAVPPRPTFLSLKLLEDTKLEQLSLAPFTLSWVQEGLHFYLPIKDKDGLETLLRISHGPVAAPPPPAPPQRRVPGKAPPPPPPPPLRGGLSPALISYSVSVLRKDKTWRRTGGGDVSPVRGASDAGVRAYERLHAERPRKVLSPTTLSKVDCRLPHRAQVATEKQSQKLAELREEAGWLVTKGFLLRRRSWGLSAGAGGGDMSRGEAMDLIGALQVGRLLRQVREAEVARAAEAARAVEAAQAEPVVQEVQVVQGVQGVQEALAVQGLLEALEVQEVQERQGTEAGQSVQKALALQEA